MPGRVTHVDVEELRVLHQPHHDGSPLHVDGRPAVGETVRVTARIPHDFPLRSVHVRAIRDGEPSWSRAQRIREDGHDAWWQAEVCVTNPITPYRFLLETGARSYAWLNGIGVHAREVTDVFDFRLSTHSPTPSWVADSVMYQVFCDRFAKSGRVNCEPPSWAVPADWSEPVVDRGPSTPFQFFGGDLWGVADRLDHIAGLGADVVYLTPFFPAESNHRYNASSFERVDPHLGGDAALVHLTEEAHRRGMRVIGDLTLNHSGDAHEWFRRAQQDPTSEEAGYYRFHAHPDAYECWLGVRSLPKFDFASVALQSRLVDGAGSIVARWLRPPFALDGWRIDVANMMARLGADDRGHLVARMVRRTARETNSDAYLLGEHFHDASADLAAGGWDGVMNYAGFLRPVWSWLAGGEPRPFLGMPVDVPSVGGAAAVATMREVLASAPWSSMVASSILLGSHDTPRIRTVMGSVERVEAAVGLLATYPGVPMVFAGDELGLEGIDGEDGRVPMPWDDLARMQHPLVDTYRRLIALRRAHPALSRGGLRWAHASDDAIAYVREEHTERLLVLAVRNGRAAVSLPATIVSRGPEILYGIGEARVGAGVLRLDADGPSVTVWAL